ncbi:glycosyltransferase family 25 protein [Bipolaris zeicola 26-R-13]|uniref:Glycosyltransferase family 25 protein n=1 Tax=Cochliobolus carbonum (strain 26-R-13) TaxID=930089 RepID=W6XX48_COCC2|nr:glycosyltransferase family 25 protein [Bipolaris zeicola 26-R-13]EUC27314.1 glycosyltransferase family 25 protein [Bipolaris zeicola 26-R-13]
MGFGSSRAPPPGINTAQLRVARVEPADDPIWDTQNSTLGFQKIYAISMAHRPDKRDYLALMGLVSHLDIEFVDGVNASLMHPKAFPAFWRGEEGLGAYGCWRAHLNVYQKMVQNQIQSALIIEDDADWDVLLKSQMLSFARGVRAIQDSTLPLHSPYGDSWNLLTLGHLGVNNKPHKSGKYYITHNDPTVIPESRRILGRKPDPSAEKLKGEHTRIVMEVNKLTGTGAYALSLHGAARLLYDQALLPNAQAIDVAIQRLCRYDGNWPEPFCLGAYPMIFGLYRGIGTLDRDSDRKVEDDEEKSGYSGQRGKLMRKKGESSFTVFPVSLNMKGLLQQETKFQAVDPAQDMMAEMDVSTFEFPVGEVVTVEPEEFGTQPVT